MRFCAGCGEEWRGEATCFACGSDTSMEYTVHNVSSPGAHVTPVDVQGEKGRMIGEAIGQVVAPHKPAVKLALGVAGRFLGRRLAKGHPIFEVGMDPQFVPAHKKARKPRKTRKKKTTKQLANKRRKPKNP